MVRAVFAAALALFAFPAQADWRVARLTGAATFSPASGTPVRLSRGAVVPDDVTIETGRNGRVALSRGSSTIVVGPLSSISLSPGLFGTTTVLQRTGGIDYEVERRDERYFSVETPFLGAVVKGTRFSVRVGSRDADVAVTRGLVGVTCLASGESADIPPGHRAATARGRLVLSGRGRKPSIIAGTPRSAGVRILLPEAVAADVAGTPPAASTEASSASPGRAGQGRGGRGGSHGGGHGHGGGSHGGNGHGGSRHSRG
jgi:ferric-dicitrate binding protein FerR (iron transport regulator)